MTKIDKTPDMVGLLARDQALDDLHFDALMQYAGLFQSYASSIHEAAWRKEPITVEMHLRQIKETLRAAVEALQALKQMAKAKEPRDENDSRAGVMRRRHEGVHGEESDETEGKRTENA